MYHSFVKRTTKNANLVQCNAVLSGLVHDRATGQVEAPQKSEVPVWGLPVVSTVVPFWGYPIKSILNITYFWSMVKPKKETTMETIGRWLGVYKSLATLGVWVFTLLKDFGLQRC